MTDQQSSDDNVANRPADAAPTAGRRGLSRRSFLAWTGAAGAGVAATAALPGSALADVRAPDLSTSGPAFTPVRPPAVPLAVRSPYLSTWLAADNLPGTWPTFWTGRITAMAGIARIDGTPYVFLGNPVLPNANPFPTMRQTALELTPTRSTFTLEQAGVRLVVEFFSPVEPGDVARQSMPLSYLSVTAVSTDKAGHDVQVYLDISGEWSSGNSDTQITWAEQAITDAGVSLISLSCTPDSPKVLTEANDTAEWGTVTWSTAATAGLTWQIGADADVRAQSTGKGVLLNTVDSDNPRAINDHYPVFAFNADLGTVGRKATAPVVVSIGQVRDPAVSYLGTNLSPLWRTYHSTWQDMVAAFHADYSAAVGRADALDAKITSAATKAGGEKYAALCAIALRQAYAGTELVQGLDGKPWAFLKEISSDGNVSTIDVTYPCMPVFIYLDPGYLGMILAPMLDYPENGGWPKEFAEHDLGSSYPNATGHNDGNEEDMPVEESANMLIMFAAVAARLSKSARTAYATAHYPILKQWADYLVGNALDPGLQNQTDDFTGFIAHSVNLALKGIIGIGAFAQIATAAGNTSDATHYRGVSTSYIGQWVTKASDDSGDHLKLAYDQPGTWSLKYNGYADRLLKTGLVPGAVAETEADWYLSRANTYGVPLDLRHTYTKADWEMWTVGWLKHRHDVRDLLIESLYTFAATSGSRLPMTDWYDTTTDKQVGFLARPVVGGFYALLTV